MTKITGVTDERLAALLAEAHALIKCDETWRGEQIAILTELQSLRARAAHPSGVRVVKLTWKNGEASSATGTYRVKRDGNDWRAFRDGWTLYSSPKVPAIFGSEGEAKAAAQADYERRILSAIEPTQAPQPVGEKLIAAPDLESVISDLLDTSKTADPQLRRKAVRVFLSALSTTPAQPSYADAVEPYAAALRMIREAVEEIFGPIASLESEEATLLRGPEPHHEAEAIIDALQRVAERFAPSNQGPVAVTEEMVERVLAWVREDVLPAYGITHATRASDPEMIEGLTAALSAKPQCGGERAMSDKHFNKLSPAEAERLACLAEECGEVIQVIGKILRHGYDDWSPLDETRTTNRHNLERELGDLSAVCQRMDKEADIDPIRVKSAHHKKMAKLSKWTHHQPDSESSAEAQP